MSGAVYDYVKQYRTKLDAPDILRGTKLQELGQEFWRETSNPGTALERPIQRLGEDTPLALQFAVLWRANYGARQLDPSDSVEEKQEILNAIKHETDAFLSIAGPAIENQRGVVAMKGMSKHGLSKIPPELQREVVGFLSPGGRSEDAATAISRIMVERGGPGVRSDVGVGRGAPGAAGGKRRKTRKGKSKSRSRRARYSRRR